ncbi:hypothetical protein [Nonomuraea harbinensis]|uniref:Uncharacterized protein n=1 Tax=Nonomuraea harbinensis TaxID=1286938 RepID=A0ABW1BMA0_9ACTN|nr:hypothetical protein [Nonomuraea harbinensis]
MTPPALGRASGETSRRGGRFAGTTRTTDAPHPAVRPVAGLPSRVAAARGPGFAGSRDAGAVEYA